MLQKVLITFILLTFLSSAYAEDLTSDAVVQKYIKCFNTINIDKMVTLFANEAQFFGTGSKTLVTNKTGIQAYLNPIKSFKSIKYTFENFARIPLVNEDAVLFTGLDSITVETPKETDHSKGRLTIIVKKEKEGMKIIHFHRSMIPQ